MVVALGLMVTACSGDAAEETEPPSDPSTTTLVTTSSAPIETSAPTSSDGPAELPITIEFEFRSMSETAEAFSYDIAYPVLAHPDAAITDRVNAAIDQWISQAVDTVSAADIEGMRASFSAQLAPELLNDQVFSISGVATSLLDATAGTVTQRVGWIFSLNDGAVVTPTELFTSGTLEALATTARDHLITDVFGDADAITVPDGLLPTSSNFDAVWLSARGIGVGFDQFQVAEGNVGSPTVLIPFTELSGQLRTTGVLAPLASGDTLPEE